MKITKEQWENVKSPLPACLHCGGTAKLVPNRPMDVNGLIFHAAYVKCTGCHAKGPFFFHEDFDKPEETWDAARAAWERSEGCIRTT